MYKYKYAYPGAYKKSSKVSQTERVRVGVVNSAFTVCSGWLNNPAPCGGFILQNNRSSVDFNLTNVPSNTEFLRFQTLKSSGEEINSVRFTLWKHYKSLTMKDVKIYGDDTIRNNNKKDFRGMGLTTDLYIGNPQWDAGAHKESFWVIVYAYPYSYYPYYPYPSRR
jgi:hypothetical protein